MPLLLRFLTIPSESSHGGRRDGDIAVHHVRSEGVESCARERPGPARPPQRPVGRIAGQGPPVLTWPYFKRPTSRLAGAVPMVPSSVLGPDNRSPRARIVVSSSRYASGQAFVRSRTACMGFLPALPPLLAL